MQRTVYILFSLLISLAVYATKVDLQPSSSTWHTAMPNDTLYLGKRGTFLVEIPEIGKYHIEQTTKDTIQLRVRANNIKDERVKQGLPSQDTLQVSFKNLCAGRKLARGNESILHVENDTCNIQLQFEGTNRLFDISNIGYGVPFVYVTGKSPSFSCGIKDSLICQKRGGGHMHYFIHTSLSQEDYIIYQIPTECTFISAGIQNTTGHVILKDGSIKENIVNNGPGSTLTLKNTYYEANDYSWDNAVMYSKGKIYIENSTLQTTNDYPFINSADTIFINETLGSKTYINAIIGPKDRILHNTPFSRVIVNKASYIREIIAMTDLYDGYIETLCPSPYIKDEQTHADLNIYGGKIGLLTNNVHSAGGGSLSYGKRIIHFYKGQIKATSTPIRLGHWYGYSISGTEHLCYNDTLNLHSGSITAHKDQCLIQFTDNTCINIHHKENSNQITRIQYHPQGERENWAVIRLKGGTVNEDSLHWEIGDINNLHSLYSVVGQGLNKQPLRLVYKNSQQPNDSLVIGVQKDSIHYFGNLLNSYNVVNIYPSFKRNITYVHTLDDTWQGTDNFYYEGFGKKDLPRVIYAGKTFKGWYTDPEGGVKIDSISHLQLGDITLYTQWGPGQDILYSDFENNRLCNTGAQYVLYYSDDENEIQAHGRPLEGYNTKAMYYNVIKNNGKAIVSLYTRNSYPKDISIYKNAPMVYMDLRSTTGLSFLHQGMSLVLGIGTKASETASKNKFTIPAHEELTLVNIPWGQFSNANTMDLEHVCKLQFQPVDEQGEFWLDNIIFTQGEIYPIEKIKLDTIPSKYLYSKNVDILDIPLPTEKAAKQLYLYAQFTPSDATYQTIAWSSADTTIVKIDENGRVSGISHGQTYIYCQSVMHPEVKDSILVGVSQGGIYYNLNGVSISNQLPTTYNYEHPVAIPAPQPINDFYTFHGWHTDSITGAVVDSASYHQFNNIKSHTLYAEFTRSIPGAAITIMQNRIVAVQNPNNYDALKEARYVWKFNNQTLPSKKMFVEVGRPIPEGTYHVTMHIDDEMPIQLERYIDASVNQNTENNNFTLYPNPIKAGNLAYLIGRYDSITLFDMNGQSINTPISDNGIITAPMQTGMYVLKIIVDNNTYSIKFIVI